MTNLVYKIACHDNQADSANEDPFSDGPVIECGKDFMRANISRTIPDFSDQGVSVPPMATWMVVIYNGTQKTKVNISTAGTYGYKLTSDNENFMIQIRYDAFGINKISARNQSLYVGDMDIVMEKLNPKITIAVKLLCATGPFQCNDTHMDIYVPQFDGYLQFVDINHVLIPIPSGKDELQRQGLIVDTSSGTQITFEKGKLKTVQKTVCLPPFTLVFAVDDISVPMRLTGLCSDPCRQLNPISTGCSNDGFMTIQVVSLLTRPSLNLDTVILGDGQCQPITKTDQLVVFSFSLTDCGTKMSFVGGVLVYENEVHALWRDKPRRIISRDSEFRETVRCQYNISDVASFAVNVLTPSPLPVSERYDGSISFVLNLYHDDSYAVLYKDNQYPVVKTLQDPIYLEVQVLNRSDPNIELILNDCWATMSSDPNASPQWKIVVDGCAEDQDNYLTVFHPVSNVALPEHRKRFEVKAFAFTVDGDVSTNLVYFHCSALICSIQSPDYALCTKSCPGSRRKRDELFLNRHSMLASLPGPLLFVDSDPAMVLQDESNVIERITLGVLPAFGIVALVVLAVVLLSHKAKP
ncbi:zona pellucida sperm-binding protein 2-like [Rana temporaria]|uniref:zona pellucida sperm-binding protein 2-like n=1 Tax=Rana temporaria TaxID=8407 RepID=UPI001AADE729|nr:zona pellucida sperm-binding protein 2-like [Rana temporaria]